MTLHLHRAARADLLVDQLGDLLAEPLADPFAEEVVVVPAKGVERWVTQRLSHRLGTGQRGGDGVCAGVRFLTPHSLVAMLLGKERHDPWEPDRLVWPLLEVIDASLGEPWCDTLATHLGHDVPGDEGVLRQNRRYSVARRLAGLLMSYAVQRPQLVTDWREGRDSDGAGSALDDDLLWQAELWRRLVRRIELPAPDVRHRETLARLRAGGEGLDLPPRLSLFGHTRLPITEIELLQALGATRDVHLWFPQVSPRLWDDLVDVSSAGPVPRRLDRSADRVGHPLLSSLGRDARELQRSLAGVVSPVPRRAGLASDAGPASDADGCEAGASTTGTLLHWLQADLRANALPTAAVREARVRGAGDRSVQVHACHGAARQIDVLREVLVGLLDDDSTLEPRDILVMCPDIETFAPLIQAGFGLGDVVAGSAGHPAHRLRVRLADRALSSTNPLLAVAGQLVGIAGGRVTATEVLDLAGTAPVRERFGFDDDDLAQCALWVDQSGIRWGLDAGHRRDYQLEKFGQNTWRAGLDRILLGVAMAEDEHRWLGTALPVDDVASGDIELAGRLAELVDRLEGTVRVLVGARTVADWMTGLADGVAHLTDVPPRDAWQVAQFERELASISDAASGGATQLRLADVRALLSQRLAGRPTRANFRTGTLTACTMVPMRSVPHRVLCLVGLDDGVFPRTSSVDGDDVLARDPRTGERDIRSEDRQLLLDAVMAATEKLVITYTGANEHTGARRPPAVPLGELLDALAATVPDEVTQRPTRTAGSSAEDFVTRHPLQPFDRRNLIPGALGTTGAFSFDRAAKAGAEAAAATRTVAGPLLPGPLAERRKEDVNLADLQRFFAHPVRHFLRTRLDVSSPLEAEETLDAIPIDLDALEKWSVGDRLLHDVLDGLDPQASMTAELLRGLLPPGQLGIQTLTSVARDVQGLVTRTAALREGTRRSLDVDLDLGGGRRLTGTVSGLVGSRIVSVSYSSLRARQRLASWIDLLALSAGHPDENWTAHAVGKARAGPTRALSGPLDHRAASWLEELVDIYDRGQCEPLPLPVKTAGAYAEAARRALFGDDVDPIAAARREWETDRNRAGAIPGEQDDAAHLQVYGAAAPIDVLTGVPRADETWNAETSRLGQYAWRVWEPLLTGGEKVGPL